MGTSADIGVTMGWLLRLVTGGPIGGRGQGRIKHLVGPTHERIVLTG